MPTDCAATAWRWLGAAVASVALAAGCHGCREPSGPCAATSDCLANEICVADTCRTVCNSDLDCLGRDTCQGGTCLPRSDAGTADAALRRDASARPDGAAQDRIAGDLTATDRGSAVDADRDAGDGAAQPDGGHGDALPRDQAVWSDRSPGNDQAAASDRWTPTDHAVARDQAAATDGISEAAAADRSPACRYDQEWSTRWSLTVDNKTTSTVIDFPLPVRLDCNSFACARLTSSSSGLRVVTPECQPLPYEVEWTAGAAVLVLWFKAPALASGSTLFYLYGDPVGVPTDQVPEPSAVWSNGYQGVYHLTDSALDSSPLGFAGRDIGTSAVDGVLGGGRSFNGTAAVDLGSNRPQLRSVPGATLSFWFNNSSVTAPHLRVLLGVSVNNGGSPAANSRASVFFLSGEARLAGSARRLDGDPGFLHTFAAQPAVSVWHHAVLRVDFANRNMALFVDGMAIESVAMTGLTPGNTSDTNAENAAIGAEDDLSGSHFTGAIDEARIATVARSDDWIALEHLSQSGDGIVDIGPGGPPP